MYDCLAGFTTNGLAGGPTQYARTCLASLLFDAADVACSDVDECAAPGGQGCRERCINMPGTFACGCDSGRELLGDGSCQDIVVSLHVCLYMCVYGLACPPNLGGGYGAASSHTWRGVFVVAVCKSLASCWPHSVCSVATADDCKLPVLAASFINPLLLLRHRAYRPLAASTTLPSP